MNKYDYIFLAGLVLWLAETALFGWHRVAQTTPELVLDRISQALIGYGAICSLITLLNPRINLHINNNPIQRKDV